MNARFAKIARQAMAERLKAWRGVLALLFPVPRHAARAVSSGTAGSNPVGLTR